MFRLQVQSPVFPPVIHGQATFGKDSRNCLGVRKVVSNSNYREDMSFSEMTGDKLLNEGSDGETRVELLSLKS